MSKTYKAGLPIILIIVGMTAYANSFNVPFIFDDEHSIHENPHILHFWLLSEAMSAPPQATVAGRPVVSLTLALNYAVSGYSVWSYHLFNLAVHILAGLALYGIVRRTLLCERLCERFGDNSQVLAWAVAAIWLVHPIQTESVTYIIQRAESLMGLFYLLTLYSAIRAMQGDKPLMWSAVSVVCCGLGMGTKEVMVTAPALVLLYDRTFAAGSFIGAFRRRWGLYAGLAATWGILAALIWSGPRSASAGFFIGYKSLDYALNQCVVILHYIRLTFWPSGLCLDYRWPIVKDWGKLALPVVVILVMPAVTVWGLVRNRLWSYPAAWFFAVLSPTSSFVPIADLAFEHRMYLPLAGLAALVVSGGYVFLERRSVKKAGLVSAVVVIGVLTAVTLLRNNDYRSAVSIWQTVLNVVPENPRGYNNLGSVLYAQGKTDEAIARFNESLRIKPDYADAHFNLGAALYSQGKSDEAVSYYRQALVIKPDYTKAHCNLGVVLQSQGKLDEAIGEFRQVLKIEPDNAAAHNNLGDALLAQNKLNEAIGHLRQAIKVNPDFAEAYNNLGNALLKEGKSDEAIDQYRQALKINPDFDKAYYNLGNAFASQGKYNEAVTQFEQALRVNPDYVEAHYNLAKTLKSQGKLDEAADHYRQMLKIKPDSVEALDNLGNLLSSQGKFDEAAACYRKALAIEPNSPDVHHNFGVSLLSQGKFDEAADHFRQALKINPNHSGTAAALQFLLDKKK